MYVATLPPQDTMRRRRGRGRPPIFADASERAMARREQVRANVQAYRRRQREATESAGSDASQSRKSSSDSLQNLHSRSPLSPQNHSMETRLVFETVHDDQGLPGPVMSQQASDSPAFMVELPFRIEIALADPNSFVSVARVGISSLAYEHGDGPQQIQVTICASVWMVKFTYRATFDQADPLSDAINASALLYLGRSDPESQLTMDGLQVLNKSLKKLREGYEAYHDQPDPDKLLMFCTTSLLLAASQFFVTKSWPSSSRLLTGVGALLEHEGPEKLNTPTLQGYFYGYRAIQLPTCIDGRKASFLGRREWVDVPWRRHNPTASHTLQTLLDTAYLIPNELALFDATTNKTPEFLHRMVQSARAIETGLRQWHEQLMTKYNGQLYAILPSTWNGPFRDRFVFSDKEIAVAYIYYLGCRATVSYLLSQLAQENAAINSSEVATDGITTSSQICQCMEYFFPVEGGVPSSSMAIFAFDAAWKTFGRALESDPGLEAEVIWCEALARRIDSSGLQILQDRFRVP